MKQIKGVVSDASASLPTSSKLSKAIESQNPNTVAQLLEDGVDPNDLIMVVHSNVLTLMFRLILKLRFRTP